MATFDILHPFASLKWEEFRQLPVRMTDPTAVWHRDKLYIGGMSRNLRDTARLYIYTPATDTWDKPKDSPVEYFTLTTYRSQLVLVGGREYVGEHVGGNNTNKLWTLSEHDQWQETLPPMRTKRRSVCAVSYKDHLLVAGGMVLTGISNVIEIFNGSHWLFTQPLPMCYLNLKSAILDQYWFLVGGEGDFLAQGNAVHYASIDSLLASCQPNETSQPSSSIWKRLTDAPYQYSSTAVFGSRLVTVGGGGFSLTSTVHAYSFHTNSWTHIGDMPFPASHTCSVVLPTGELMVLGGYDGSFFTGNVLKSTIRVIPYDPDIQFTMMALSRLEDIGIPIISSMDTNFQCLQQVLSRVVPNTYAYTQSILLLDTWLSCGMLSRLPPTWKTLLQIIHQLGLDELAHRMEIYLSGATALEEQQPDSEMSNAESESTEGAEKQLQMRDEVICKLKQDISLLKEESDSTIFILKGKIASLTAENDKLRSQQLVKKETDSALEEKTFLPQIKTESKEEDITVTTPQPESIATCTWNLCGAEVCGEMTVVVYSSHYQQITWPGYGLKLHIPKGCLPADMEQCTINIKASLAGQYEFPENSHLVSAVFWLRCEDVYKFTKLITVEIEHCAKSLKLNFFRAVCSQKQLPYTFKQLPGGNFTSHSSYGAIDLNSFSGVGITQEGSEERQYYSKLFYLSNYFGGHRIDLAISWNTEAHINAVKKHYNGERALPGPDQPVQFEGEEIRLEFPMEETKINDMWTIVPLIDPVVTKSEVDSYHPGTRLPHCELEAHPIEGKPVTRLVHKLLLLGAKPPRNKFTLSYMPPSVSEASLVQSPLTSSVASEAATIPELRILLRELRKVANEWEDIGIELAIEEGQLRQIKSDNAGDSKACLREMLRVWLSRVAPPPSWSAMADALDTLGHEDVATHLKTVYIC